MLRICNRAVSRSIINLSARRTLAFQASNIRLSIAEKELKTGKPSISINTELPDPTQNVTRQRLGFVAFVVALGSSLALIFNYEKTESPIVVNTIYYLRRSATTRELLGDNIEFEGLIPWVSGKLNQVQGKVDIKFHVIGSNNISGTVKLVADRENRGDEFLIHKWTLTADGKVIDLLSEVEGASI